MSVTKVIQLKVLKVKKKKYFAIDQESIEFFFFKKGR